MVGCHLCYPKGSSGPVNVIVGLALIIETEGTESRRGGKNGTHSRIKNIRGWRIMEKTWWKTLSAQSERVCLQCHTGTDKNCCMASQQHSLPSKERQHLVWWNTTDLTPLWLSLHIGFHKLQCISNLLATGIKKTLKWDPPHPHIFITFPYSNSKKTLIIMGKETANLFKNIIWQSQSCDTRHAPRWHLSHF